ncbi:MAG TPA: TetR/AcrR family transcriptional regulator [Solirubrobacter sp.]|nr:TetR/AcrR family transcriptional regulator [Solirubrobacter sp.]
MGAASQKPIKGRAPHRRNEDARLAVLHAADDLLVERGFGGVTIEGIAARAGVAKQTIYRWWPSKVDILLDTLIEDAERQIPVTHGGSTLKATQAYLRALAKFLSKEPAGRVLLSLVGEAQHDEAMATVFRERYLAPRRAQERAMLQAGIDAGELDTALDVDATLDALIGPIVYRALIGAKIPRTFVDTLIATNLEPHRAND